MLFQQLGIHGQAQQVDEYGPSTSTSNVPPPPPRAANVNAARNTRTLSRKAQRQLQQYGCNGQPQQVDEYGPSTSTSNNAPPPRPRPRAANVNAARNTRKLSRKAQQYGCDGQPQQ